MQILNCVADRHDYDDEQTRVFEVLLEFKILVGREKSFEAGDLCLLQQLAVLEPSPTLLLNGSDFVQKPIVVASEQFRQYTPVTRGPRITNS